MSAYIVIKQPNKHDTYLVVKDRLLPERESSASVARYLANTYGTTQIDILNNMSKYHPIKMNVADFKTATRDENDLVFIFSDMWREYDPLTLKETGKIVYMSPAMIEEYLETLGYALVPSTKLFDKFPGYEHDDVQDGDIVVTDMGAVAAILKVVSIRGTLAMLIEADTRVIINAYGRVNFGGLADRRIVLNLTKIKLYRQEK